MTETIRPSTRDALVAGAQAVLAETGPGVPVSTITERAGVAVGSFYNHFESKDALFREAAAQAMSDFEDFLIASTQHLADPATVLCTRMRLYCRMSDSHEQIARILVNAAPQLLAHPSGYSPQAVRDVQAAVATGQLDGDDVTLRLVMITGGAMRLVSARLLDTSIPTSRADDFAALGMELLGMPREQARAMVAVPLEDLVPTSAPER